MSRHASTGNPYGPVGMDDGPPARFVDHEPFPARRCRCGRPVPASSMCDCCCCEHDHPSKELPA